MNLAAKLISGILVAMFAVLVLDGYLTIRRDTELALAGMNRDSVLLGHTLKRLVLETQRGYGEQRAAELFGEANRGEHQIKVRWVRLDDDAPPDRRPMVAPSKLKPLLRGEDLSLRIKQPSGDDYLVTYVLITAGGTRPTAIELVEPLASLKRFSRSVALKTLVLAAALLFAGSVIVGLFDEFPPVILITAFGDESTHDQAKRLGAAAIFDKPFNIDDLLHKASEILATRPSKSSRPWCSKLPIGIGFATTCCIGASQGNFEKER